jgi:hypothetical protein
MPFYVLEEMDFRRLLFNALSRARGLRPSRNVSTYVSDRGESLKTIFSDRGVALAFAIAPPRWSWFYRGTVLYVLVTALVHTCLKLLVAKRISPISQGCASPSFGSAHTCAASTFKSQWWFVCC